VYETVGLLVISEGYVVSVSDCVAGEGAEFGVQARDAGQPSSAGRPDLNERSGVGHQIPLPPQSIVRGPPNGRSSTLTAIPRPRIAAWIASFGCPASDVDDVTQDAMLAIHLALPRLRDEAATATFCHRIARNVWLMHLRRERARPLLGAEELKPHHAQQTPNELESKVDARLALSRTLHRFRTLTPGQRRAVVGIADGTTTMELSSRLGCADSTLRRHLQDARARLVTGSGRTGPSGGRSG